MNYIGKKTIVLNKVNHSNQLEFMKVHSINVHKQDHNLNNLLTK